MWSIQLDVLAKDDLVPVPDSGKKLFLLSLESTKLLINVYESSGGGKNIYNMRCFSMGSSE